MKLASYVAGGKACYGAVVGDGVVTLKGHASLRDALAAGTLDDMRKASSAKPDHKLSDIRFLPVIPNPHKILCAGVNYKSHAAEVGRELPKQPSMFIRFTDTLVGHESEMIRPRLSDNFDFEGELTMVVGRAAAISRSTAHWTMSPAIRSSSTAACATTRSSRSRRARTGRAPARSAPGSSRRMRFPIRAS
jgi:2-keto-4-pentenoate hydratase/2-oxohepta-3-ene-1,7-dioic acid hydratase in catechol pathway